MSGSVLSIPDTHPYRNGTSGCIFLSLCCFQISDGGDDAPFARVGSTDQPTATAASAASTTSIKRRELMDKKFKTQKNWQEKWKVSGNILEATDR